MNFAKTLVTTHKTTWCHNQEEISLNFQDRKNIKYHQPSPGSVIGLHALLG